MTMGNKKKNKPLKKIMLMSQMFSIDSVTERIIDGGFSQNQKMKSEIHERLILVSFGLYSNSSLDFTIVWWVNKKNCLIINAKQNG